MHIHTLMQHSACHAGRDASNDCNNSGIDVNVAASKSKAPRLVDFSTTPLDIAQVYNQKVVMVGHGYLWAPIRIL
jgi:hypothetical protein